MGLWLDSANLVLRSCRRSEGIEERRREFMQIIASSFPEEREQALLYLEELVDRFDGEFLSDSIPVIRKLLLERFFGNIYLENMPAQGEEALVFLSNHRSMFDFLIEGVVLAENGIRPPRYAAGKNLFVPPLGNIFRKWGAVALDRNQKGPLYIGTEMGVFTQYLLDGTNLIIYPEAGRSYTGRFKKLRRGMLQSVIGAHEKDPDLKYKIVITTISYDRTAEDFLLVLSEQRKQRRGGVVKSGFADKVADISRLFPVWWANCGNAYLTFGKPFDLDEIEGESKRAGLVQKVNDDFRRQYKITGANVAAYCIADSGLYERRVDYERKVSETVGRLKEQGRNIERGLENLTVDELLEDRLVRRIVVQPGMFVMPKNRGLVNYYANAVRDVLNED